MCSSDLSSEQRARCAALPAPRTADACPLHAQRLVVLDLETTGLGRVQSFNAEYAAGPIYAGLGFEQVKDGSNDGRGVTSVALHYNFGVVKPILYYAQGKTDANGDTEAKVYMIGATAPLGLGVGANDAETVLQQHAVEQSAAVDVGRLQGEVVGAQRQQVADPPIFRLHLGDPAIARIAPADGARASIPATDNRQ